VEWQRAQGQYGGGTRYVAQDEALFNRASVNISQVQYEKDQNRKLASASAISSIVHPRNPFAPSMHIHISWTEMKGGEGYWRIMADLNPSIPVERDQKDFERALQEAAGELYQSGKEQGERYFYIPALGRHRGVAHFYLEEYRTKDQEADFALAKKFGTTMIDAYTAIVARALREHPKVSLEDQRRQLEYHSLYFLQVLTLDRGTTSGLLVHDENDTGILGSLPSHVDQQLLQLWVSKLPPLQQKLLQVILDTLSGGTHSLVDDPTKVKIAQVSREFYQRHPEAQDLLARGNVIPPTQDNHEKGSKKA
jgi:coproporphyrinogen III oxidase